MEFSFDEGFANITVPDQNTTLSAYNNQLRLYDAHIAKMFEITHFLCHNGAEGSIEWSYQAGGGSINMGDFLVSCQLANDLASAYGLGIPEKTAIQFSQGEEESPIVKNFDVSKFNITDNKIPR